VVKLAVGDLVVYGAHGAGTVETRETRSVQGELQTVVVVALAGGLRVQLPLALAREQLRALVDEDGLSTVEQVLHEAPPSSGESSWLKRRREALEKLGDAIGLAEIIRDGYVRESAPVRGLGSRLAPSERELVQRARGLLTSEIALARNVPVADAEAWLDRQLAVGT
jgi:CarD family transcriptional regulator, regulator of rRNA transcription